MATWKKVIVSGSSANLANLQVDSLSSGVVTGAAGNLTTTAVNGTGNIVATTGATGLIHSGSFSGSFQGDGSGLTGVTAAGTISSSIQVDHDQTTNFVANEHIDHTTVSITAGSGLTGGGTIAATRTINVGAGDGISVAADAVSVDGTVLRTTGDGVVSGSSQISLGGDLSGTADNATVIRIQNVAITSGEATQLANIDTTTISATQWGYLGALDQSLTQASSPTFAGMTVAGDLVVTGDTLQAQVTNLNVEDQFILLNSGSTTGDAGIIFGGANGTANTGVGLIWDFSYNTNDGRLAIVNTLAADATSTTTPDYYVAGVYEGTEANAATAQADHPGNIRIDSGEIYIYV